MTGASRFLIGRVTCFAPRQFVSPTTVPGEYTKTITVYDEDGVQTGMVTKTFTVDPPPADGPPATPRCGAPESSG